MGIWKVGKEDERMLEGTVKAGRKTKQLIVHVEPKQIIVIDHDDIDEMAATAIVEAKVKAVINAGRTMTGNYPVFGPMQLLRAGVPIFEIDPSFFSIFQNDTAISIGQDSIHSENYHIPYREFTEADWTRLTEAAHRNLGAQLNDFIENTLHYASKEKDFVTKPLALPMLNTEMSGKHVVVVVRGSGYKNDLLAIQDYIADYKPVLIGVDGGADALIEYGHTPDLIVGDMDSISDRALQSNAEIIVHAYPDGRAPGMQRIAELGLSAQIIAAPGTSEDIAMLLAYEKNAELIVTLGTHTHMIDFLEKGRKGMSSTMLVRMKIGSKLVDAKGVSKLYHRPVKWRKLWVLPVAGLFPLVMLGLIHPGMRHFMNIIWMYVKLSLS